MRRVLRTDGSIYLHIDHTAHAWVKAMMDSIFGRRNFLNEIVWCYKSGGASPKRHFSRKHDSILLYKRGSQYTFNPQREKSYNRQLKPYRFAGVEEFEDEVGWYTLVGMKDYWQIDMVGRTSSERTGFPTQKPLALYERMVLVSSNPGDIVLDPFCGCATTPISAERLDRQWVGIDIWEGALDVVKQRMEDNRQLLSDPNPQIQYQAAPPDRTDEGEVAAPILRLKLQRPTEPWQRLTHAQIVEHLVAAQSSSGFVMCGGCGRVLEREFMELDHILPRADGGANDITNRILLCRPCNGRKSASLTLTGLVRQNRKVGWMQNDDRTKLAQSSARLRADAVRDGMLQEVN